VRRNRGFRFKFEGVTKSESDKLRDEISLVRGTAGERCALSNTREPSAATCGQGLLKANAVTTRQERPTRSWRTACCVIDVDKGPKVKIKRCHLRGQRGIKRSRLRRAMKKTKRKRWYNIFGSKFTPRPIKEDKERWWMCTTRRVTATPPS
jgi:outer membrane protein insertion porin family